MVFQPRVCGEDLYHHLYAWGNDRHPVFRRDYHYRYYLSLPEKYSRQFKIDVIAYAMMEWHVHLFIHDLNNNISEFMMKFHGEYAQYFNRNAGQVGHVFGERFNNKIVQANEHGIWLSRYIHRQAIKAGLVENPREYKWASYQTYIGLDQCRFLKPGIILNQFGNDDDKRKRYEEFVLGYDDGSINWDQKTTIAFNIDYILNNICRRMEIEKSALLNPRGYEQKADRHKIIKVLHAQYDFKPSQIARALNMTRSAITQILSTEQ
jgi:REP element-mobilizing transposase RayT